jgi:hypothetical protein
VAEYKIPYRGLTDSLKHFRVQVFDSIPYCIKNIPEFEDPKDLFYYLKKRTKYKSDPKNVELFQSAKTLLENNYHGESGAGDCDCFSCLCLASLICNGWYNVGIVLAGKKKHHATHIYTYVDTPQGRKILDLTNPNYNEQRHYNYIQFIPFKISKNQIDMFLQLADNSTNKKRLNLGYDPYIFIPSKNLRVREDIYDDLSLKDFCDEMLSEGYDLEQISTLAGRRKERVDQRRAIRTEKKQVRVEKQKAGVALKMAKAEKKASTGRARETKAEAKRIRAEKGEQTPAGKLISKAGELIGKITTDGEFIPQEQEEFIQPEYSEEIETTPEEVQEEVQEEELQDSGSFNIIGMQIPKPVVYIGSALILGAIALNRSQTRNRR